MRNLRHALLCFLVATTTWATASDPARYVLPTSVGSEHARILSNKTDKAMVFDYEGRPSITIIDFPSLSEQGRMFNRVVALIERIGAPRARVLTNDELTKFIQSIGKTEATLAYGNDFLISELVIFFNLADMGNIRLNPEELALRQLLLDRQQIKVRNGFYQAVQPNAVILSVPQVTVDGVRPKVSELARRTILTHEISHAVFYTNPRYANYCRQFWREVMTDSQRDAFRKFLSTSGYSPDNEEMMVNESQAYLMYTPDPRAFSAKMLGLGDGEISLLRQAFRAGFPEAPPSEAK